MPAIQSTLGRQRRAIICKDGKWFGELPADNKDVGNFFRTQMGKTALTLSVMVKAKDVDLHICITSRNLTEVRQFKKRCIEKFDDDSVKTLASVGADYNNMKSVWLAFQNKDEWPSDTKILIYCCHSKRMEDTRGLLKSMGLNSRTFSLIFDEVDKAENSDKFIELRKWVKKEKTRRGTLEELCKFSMWTTATPQGLFMKRLERTLKHGLIPINNLIPDEIKEPTDYYRSLKDHKWIGHDKHLTNDPVNFSKYLIDTLWDELFSSPIRGFCPAKTTVKTHEAMAELWVKEMNAIVIMHNGQEKGIRFPRNVFEMDGDFDELIRRWKLPCNSEDYVVFRTVAEKFPNHHIIMTGNITIGRSYTIQTKGFNFTDAIFPLYFQSENINKIIQMVGRVTGDIQHTGKVNIHYQKNPRKTENLKTICFEYDSQMELLQTENPEMYTSENINGCESKSEEKRETRTNDDFVNIVSDSFAGIREIYKKHVKPYIGGHGPRKKKVLDSSETFSLKDVINYVEPSIRLGKSKQTRAYKVYKCNCGRYVMKVCGGNFKFNGVVNNIKKVLKNVDYVYKSDSDSDSYSDSDSDSDSESD